MACWSKLLIVFIALIGCCLHQPLRKKETKALKIIAEHINQIVNMEKLMKEIWEDEGIVVISRNVDVLLSKLRKKLSDDNSFKFINVHGRGYKFIIE